MHLLCWYVPVKVLLGNSLLLNVVTFGHNLKENCLCKVVAENYECRMHLATLCTLCNLYKRCI